MTTPRRIAIVTSRLPRLIEPQAVWLGALRAALRLIQRFGATLVTADGTAGVEFIRRGAARLAIDVEVLPVGEDGWADSSIPDRGLPVRDQQLIASAEMVIVLGLRTNGTVHRLLRQNLAGLQRVLLVDLCGLQSQAARDEFVELGAKLWAPTAEEQDPLSQSVSRSVDESRTNVICEVVPVPSDPEWRFLSHTTRGCAGPWPGQCSEDYCDSLLDHSEDADHSALATLKRIVSRRILLASSRLIRGGYSVVCLTQAPLAALPKLRQFRIHRTRWDFEPFGLCIHREWLQQRGARPVVYGDDARWNQLAEADRPFYQHTKPSDVDDDRHNTDWTVEQEWRHVGDLDLQTLPSDSAYVFVPNFESARAISKLSPWPVTLWPGGEGLLAR